MILDVKLYSVLIPLGLVVVGLIYAIAKKEDIDGLEVLKLIILIGMAVAVFFYVYSD